MNYNSDINPLGSIPDYHLIYRALPLLYGRNNELEKLLVTDNEFNFRTERSRKRFLFVLNSAFITKNESINKLAGVLIDFLENDEQAKALIVFWLFSINNRLFYELNRDIFLKYYYQGRAELPKNDVMAYLKNLIAENSELKGKWSEETIDTMASKYLTVLKKLGLLEGRQKKTFRRITISNEMLAVFVHFFARMEGRKINVLEDEFLPFSFVSAGNMVDRLKTIGKKDWIKMNYTGASLEVEGKFEINTIAHGIFG
jgi:hypothetical protein